MIDRALFLPADAVNDQNAVPISDTQTVPNQAVTELMLEMLRIRPSDSVLEVGTGSGYQTACLAERAWEVVTIEPRPIAGVAEKLPHNVTCITGDGREYLSDEDFDKVLVTCGVESVEPWAKCLKDGGILVAPVGTEQSQELTRFRKKHGELVKEQVTAYVRFTWRS